MLTFFPHSNHLQIAQVICLRVDICVGLMFIDILIAGESIRQDPCREEIIHQLTNGCVGS